MAKGGKRRGGGDIDQFPESLFPLCVCVFMWSSASQTPTLTMFLFQSLDLSVLRVLGGCCALDLPLGGLQFP